MDRTQPSEYFDQAEKRCLGMGDPQEKTNKTGIS